MRKIALLLTMLATVFGLTLLNPASASATMSAHSCTGWPDSVFVNDTSNLSSAIYVNGWMNGCNNYTGLLNVGTNTLASFSGNFEPIYFFVSSCNIVYFHYFHDITGYIYGPNYAAYGGPPGSGGYWQRIDPGAGIIGNGWKVELDRVAIDHAGACP